MTSKKPFDKPALSIKDQINLLEKRNLIIDNAPEASHYLSTIGYYRLMGYAEPFLLSKSDIKQEFKQNSEFSDILNLYIFDRELRLLVVDALERIEVALRAAVSNVMSIKYGAHWYANSSHFLDQNFHEAFTKEVEGHLRRSKEEFIQSYYEKYNSPEHPPSWMVMECLSFGTLSKIYSNIKDRSARKEIGDILGQYSEILKSWMKALTYTRNLCAHHSRLWNRFFINKPKEVNIKIISDHNQSPFSMQVYIIIKLLNKIAPHHHWKNKLFELFNENPTVQFSAMGFSLDWRTDPIWNL